VSDADSNRSRVYLLQEEQIRKKILHMNADSILLTKLCECAQVLTPEEWQAWYAVYLQAASSLEDREARIAAVAEKLETNFELIGVTAIEDKLQARPVRVRARVHVLGRCTWRKGWRPTSSSSA